MYQIFDTLNNAFSFIGYAYIYAAILILTIQFIAFIDNKQFRKYEAIALNFDSQLANLMEDKIEVKEVKEVKPEPKKEFWQNIDFTEMTGRQIKGYIKANTLQAFILEKTGKSVYKCTVKELRGALA